MGLLKTAHGAGRKRQWGGWLKGKGEELGRNGCGFDPSIIRMEAAIKFSNSNKKKT